MNFAVPAKYVAQLDTAIGKAVALGQGATKTKRKTFVDDLQAGRSIDGVTAGSFLWYGRRGDTLSNDGRFTVSLKNDLDSGIRAAVVLVVFHDESGEVVDMSVVSAFLQPGGRR